MGNRHEVKYPNGAVSPDPRELDYFNSLTGPIHGPSTLMQGVAAVLGLGTIALVADGCTRPAEVRPTTANPKVQATIEAAVRATMTAAQPGRTPANAPRSIDSQKTPETQKEAKPILDIKLVKRNSLAPGSENTIQGEPVVAKGLDGKEKQLTSTYFLPGATVIKDDDANYHVKVGLNDEGSKLFNEILDGTYLDRKLKNNETVAIFIDGKFTWLSFYLDSRSVVVMSFKREEDATRLADLLNKEALARQGDARVGEPQRPAAEAKPEAGWQTTRSTVLPFEAQYPADMFITSGTVLSSKEIVRRADGTESPIAEVSVRTETVNSWVRLEDMLDQIKEQVSKESYINRFQLLNQRSISFGGQPGIRLEYTGTHNFRRVYKGDGVWIYDHIYTIYDLNIRNGQLWTKKAEIHFFLLDKDREKPGSPNNKDRYYPVVLKVLDSFKFLPTGK